MEIVQFLCNRSHLQFDIYQVNIAEMPYVKGLACSSCVVPKKNERTGDDGVTDSISTIALVESGIKLQQYTSLVFQKDALSEAARLVASGLNQ